MSDPQVDRLAEDIKGMADDLGYDKATVLWWLKQRTQYTIEQKTAALIKCGWL